MNKYLSFIVLSLFFILFTQSIDVGYIFTIGRDYGEYSPKLTAQPELGNIHSDYYVCGVDLLESSWVVTLWNCRCGKRWYSGRRRWRCNYCPNWFWSQVSAGRIKYCHKDNWDNQRTQVFTSGKTSTQNWRQTTCPKGQYATGIAIRLASQHGVDLAMNGLQLRCQNINFTLKSVVQDNYGYPLTQMSKNPAKTFITGLQFRFIKNDKFTGIKAYFGQNLKPESVTIEYGKAELIGDKVLKTIETIEEENRGIQAKPYNIKFSQNYSTSGSWTNDMESLNYIQFPETIVVPRPTIEGTKAQQNKYYKVTARSPFQFKLCLSTTYAPVNTVPTEIPYCHVQKGIAVVEEQRVKVAYTMSLKYIISTTNEVIYQKVTGVYEGFVESFIKTDTSSAAIAGCQQD